MNRTWIDLLLIPGIKIAIVIGAVLLAVPLMVWLERKVIARIQNRPGPNRVGPFGLLQTIADGVKLVFKEDILPSDADKLLYLLAPLLTFTPAILLMAVVPFGPEVEIAGHQVRLSIANLNIGILYYFAITSLAVYGIIFAGWASNNKYSLLGGLRSSAQMISYELPLGLSVVGVFLLASSFNVYDIIEGQGGGIWNWYVFRQPAAFVLFLIAGFAETNRLPFDLPEGEAELTGGFHTEYSSMKFAMFFLAEYANMIVFSSLITTLFLGGYAGPISLGLTGIPAALAGLFWYFAKVFFFVFFFIFIRGTLPRFRYDQLMDLGWKILLPLGLANAAWTAFFVALFPDSPAQAWCLLGMGIFAIFVVDRGLTIARRRMLHASGA